MAAVSSDGALTDGSLSSLFLAVGVGLPCTVMQCGDVIYRSTLAADDQLRLTVGGVLLLLLLGTYMWATPGVVPGFFDMFVYGPIERKIRPQLKKSDVKLGRKLGEGAYGSVFRATIADKPGEEFVVKKASEFGAAELWMNERVRRACPQACADFVDGFVEVRWKGEEGGREGTEKTKTRDNFWIVWRFEGNATFADVLQDENFPYNVSVEIILMRLHETFLHPFVPPLPPTRGGDDAGARASRAPQTTFLRAFNLLYPLNAPHPSSPPPLHITGGEGSAGVEKAVLGYVPREPLQPFPTHEHSFIFTRNLFLLPSPTSQVEKAVLGYVPREPKGPEREMRVIRTILKRILKSVDKLHSVGIVHRDIKPQNMIFNSDTGMLKIIDLGAAADLRVGINYNPNEFLLDPRYAAPEQYIMSTQTPNAPPPTIAALLSPVLWQMNLPDRFDMYSVGIIFLQMVFPNLRTDSPLIQFNRQLKRCEYDLAKWREVQEGRALSDAQLKAFAMLDADGGHGWSLLQALVNVKPGRRISAAGALAHPFFYPGDVPLLQQLRLGFVRFLYRDNTELSEAFGTFMSKAGTDEAGGFTEASLMEFKVREGGFGVCAVSVPGQH
ncbi:unnamed protein product [Closterium sp. NIES-65]|nr:unnamed protein product [Closterium sp. NIES-65]